jgi:dTDP-4-amino-4,6-dideoxygalactose transaminase
VVTEDDELAERIRLIRNHAEAVVEDMGREYLVNMIGFNFRLPEMEAAIARCQLKKLNELVRIRQKNCEYLEKRLSGIPAVVPPKIRQGCTHTYYVHAFKFREDIAGVSRDRFIEAVCAELPPTELREGEGPLLSCGYVKPLYLQPMYQRRVAYGSKGYPFTSPWYEGHVDYGKGSCPVTERMHEKELFLHEMMRPGMTTADLDDVVKAFEKVWKNRQSLEGSP